MNMKRILFLIVCTILLYGCKSKTVEIPNEDTIAYVDIVDIDSLFNTPWMAAYMDYLKTDSLPCNLESYRCWGLAYIDDDEIPELVFLCNCEACGKMILMLHNGQVVQWDSWRNGVEYAPRKGLIRNSDGSMGHYYDRFIRLKDGVFIEYLYHDVNENYVFDSVVDDCSTNYYSFTIYNSDTICNDKTEKCDVWEREVHKFESLPHIEMDYIATYHIDVLMVQLEK